MKVNEILPDDKDYRMANVVIHLKKKKKANPVKSRTGQLTNFLDVFGGMSDYNSPGKNNNTQAVQ